MSIAIGDLIFSYQETRLDKSVRLEQIETGFSISMEAVRFDAILKVKSFKFEYGHELERRSYNLYDAAVMEIVLESLKLLIERARQDSMFEIYFELPVCDAKYLNCFEGLLGTPIHIATRDNEARISISVYDLPLMQDVKLAKIESIEAKIKQDVWKAQNNDAYAKYYLQKHQRGTRLGTATGANYADVSNNIIPFPKSTLRS